MAEFVSTLPCAEIPSTRLVAAVHEVSLREPTHRGRCRQWHQTVQPIIAAQPGRLDRDWNWHRFITPLVLFGHSHRAGRIFQLSVTSKQHPAAMVALLENERWHEDPALPAVFLWYLSAAPPDTLRFADQAGTIVTPGMVGRAAFDIAVCVALNSCQGRLWLHAAPEGGDDLLRWYENRGMARIDPVAYPTLPGFGPIGRRNDGRYFCLTIDSARRAYESMTHFRKS